MEGTLEVELMLEQLLILTWLLGVASGIWVHRHWVALQPAGKRASSVVGASSFEALQDGSEFVANTHRVGGAR